MSEILIQLMSAMEIRCYELNVPAELSMEPEPRFTSQYHDVLFAKLPDRPDRDVIHDALEVALHKTLDVWKEASQANANDIYLIFVGPLGSSEDDQWRTLAAEIERDERLCRKLVWLPSDGGGTDMFIRRTFLARPWEEGRTEDADTLAVLGQDVGVPREWLSLLRDPELEGKELLLELMKQMPGDGE